MGKHNKEFEDMINEIKADVDDKIRAESPEIDPIEKTPVGLIEKPKEPSPAPTTTKSILPAPKPIKTPIPEVKPKIDEISTEIDKEEGKSHKADVPLKVDTFFGIANLVESQTHLEFSAQRCLGFADIEREKGNEEKAKQFEDLSYQQQLIAQNIRHLRGSVLSKFLKNIDEDIYCYSKHMMESTVRFMEVAEKMIDKEDREEANRFYRMADQCHELFWLVQELPRIKDISPELSQEH